MSQILNASSKLPIMLIKEIMQTVELKPKTNYSDLLNLNSKSEISPVKTSSDSQGEYIEIDFEKMNINTIYLVSYDNEPFAVQRISEHEFSFYDVL